MQEIQVKIKVQVSVAPQVGQFPESQFGAPGSHLPSRTSPTCLHHVESILQLSLQLSGCLLTEQTQPLMPGPES